MNLITCEVCGEVADEAALNSVMRPKMDGSKNTKYRMNLWDTPEATRSGGILSVIDLASALGKKFVFFNDRGDSHRPAVIAAVNPHNSPFTLHADTFRQRNFRRECQREADG